MTARADVATLVAQMNDALASIHSTIEGLSTSAAESDTKLDELEQKRDMTLAELKAAYEKEQQELAAARQKEQEEIAEQRRREDEEREARRRREDEERAARKAKEDEEKQGTFDTTARNVEDEMDSLMDNVEEETAKKIAEGEAKLAQLEEKRRELNRLIEEQMKAAVPPVPTRKRARTVRNSGAAAAAAAASAEPSPLPRGEAPAEAAPKDKSVEEEAPRSSDEAQANAPTEEDKGLEGDDSQPQPEEPVAERRVEEGNSIHEAQRSEVTPPTEAVASGPEVAAEDKASSEETVVEVALSADASKPESEPEAEPAKDLGESVQEEPASNAAAATVEDSQQNALAGTEEPPAELQSSDPAEEKAEAEKAEGTSENAPVEVSSAAEEPSAEEPSSQEPAAAKSAVAEDAPATTPATIEAVGGDPVEDAPQDKEELISDESVIPKAAEAEALAEEPTSPESSTKVGEQQEDSTTSDDNSAKEQPASHSKEAEPKSSPADERDDIPEAKEEQAAGEDVDKTTKERSVPEFSMKAVVDEHASEEDDAAESTEQVSKGARQETGDIKEHHEKDSGEARDIPEHDSKAVEEGPSRDDDAAVEVPSHLDEAAPGEEAKLEENKDTLEATSPEPEEPTGPLTEESDATPKETPKDSDAADDKHTAPAQEDVIQDAGIASVSSALEDVPAQEAAPAHEGIAKELDAPDHEEVQDREDATESAEPESPTIETAPVHNDAAQDDTAASIIQTAESVPTNVEDSSEEQDMKDHFEEQENDRIAEDSLPQDKASMIDGDKHQGPVDADDKDMDDEPAGDATAAEETSAREVAFNEEPSEPTDDESLSEAQAGSQRGTETDGFEAADDTKEAGPSGVKYTAAEPSYSEASPTEDRSEAQIDQHRDNEDADLAHIKDVAGQERSATGGELQTQHGSQETPVEVSELPQTTQEEEEHLPTAASKDLEDGDSERGDAPHTPEEQLAGSVPDAAEDDSAVGPSDATTNAHADVHLTEDAEAEGRARDLAHEGQAEDKKLDEDQSDRAEALAAVAADDQNDKVDNSDSLEAHVEVEKAQSSSWEPHDSAPESRDMPLSAGHVPEETSASDEAEETEKEKDASAFTAGPDHHETRSSLADGSYDEDNLKEATNGQEEASSLSSAHGETAKAVVGDEGRAHDAELSDEEEEAHDQSRLNDPHLHGSQDAADATRESQGSSVELEPESKQHDSQHEEVEVSDPSRDEVSFDDVDRSREPDLSVITEHTESAASAVVDTSEVAAKSEEFFHPESMSRNVSAAPDATLDSSYMTETTSMAADQSYEQNQQHGGFLPAVGGLDHNNNGFFPPDRAHFDEEESDISSPVHSVKEDGDMDEPSEASYNPFARANAASYEQPAYQSSDIPYNPFALQTVIEEEPALNPFARKTTDDASEASNNPFSGNTTSAAENFLRSASALGHSQPSSPEQSFARSASAQGRRDSVGSNNPFARSMTPLGQHDVARSLNDPFARPPSAQGHYEAEDTDTDTDDEEALAAAESTYKHLFPVRNSPPIASEGLATQAIEHRRPTPQVPESAYGNPFATRGSPVGLDVAGENDYSFAGVDRSMNPGAQQFAQESSPLSARHLAPASLDSIQERYNSELEDMDSDSEEPESLTTSQQLPASQQRAVPPMPSIAERSFQDADDSDEEEEEDWESHGPQNGRMDNVLTSPEYRQSPPPPPPPQRSLNSHGLNSEEVDNSSEEEVDIFSANPPHQTQTSTLTSSQYSATPLPPLPTVLSSEGHYSQQPEPEDSSEGEQNEWDDASTSAKPSNLPFSQPGAPVSGPPPPRSPSPLSQTQLHVENSDEEDEVVLPPSITQPNIPSALSFTENQAAPSPTPPPPAPSSQGLDNQEHQDSSEDNARPGQFPFSSSSQSRATPPPPPRAPSSHGQYRHDLENSDDEEDEWESKATLPGQTPGLSASQHRATPPPPPPPRATSAQGRYRQELADSDSEGNEEEWEANQYGQTTNLMGASNLMGSNQTAQTNVTEPASRESVPATSSQDLQSHQREEDGEESDDSWENIGQRGETHAAGSADPTSPALPTPQLRVDGYEQRWSNASNDRISTASTYLQQSGPGDFTDTESQEYATPLPSAEFSASSQYTQGVMDSPRHPESAGLKNTYDQSYSRGVVSPTDGRDASSGQRSSLAEELARGDDSDSDVGEYDHTQAPAFLTQGFVSQQQHLSNESVIEQVVTTSHSDEEDGPKTAVISSDEHPAQYASARFGATSWRDELRSPVLFGATRHSRSGSFREEVQQSLHDEEDASHPSSPQPARQPELPDQDPYTQHESHVYGQGVRDQQPQLYGQDPDTPRSPEQHPYDQVPLETQPSGLAGGSASSQPELRVEISGVQTEEDDEQRTPHMAPQQSGQHGDVSPLALRQESPATPSLSSRGTPSRGLAFSRHNPERPQTPPGQTAAAEDGIDPELIIPRDVTNVPWHARSDSVPYSVQSQSTIDSMASSPVHSALHADKHEPVIRDSWPASMHNLTRPRNDSTLTDRDDYDPFKYEGGVKALRGPSGSVGSASDTPHRNSVSNGSPGSLISRMRGIFENSQQARQEPASPARSRPVSGLFHPVQRTKTGGSGGGDSPGVKRDAEYDELDERPRRKYRRDASGLRVLVVADQAGRAGGGGGGGGPEEPPGESVFRLAWVFVEGWRHRLQKAGDTIERSRWEWELGGVTAASTHTRASSLTFGEVLADARARAPAEHAGNGDYYCGKKKRTKNQKQRKSVHWA
ncbi:hypothetical protein LX32DRAFT_694125 [Colletotrichum zoysiae]|uniref:Uncharacterized protein n=1 Tax=Colletotrichum zoysiae TaxID=1216348 RepID=A0AAD9HFY5_9PEZI|nr:hypothetical protein LX32DRAFT_694125 [Colletotrichum zoysiae]